MSEIEAVQASILQSCETLPVTGVGNVHDVLGSVVATLVDIAPGSAEIETAAADLAEGQGHAANAVTAMATGVDHLNTYLAVIMGTPALTETHVQQERAAEAVRTPSVAEQQPLPEIDTEFASLKANEQATPNMEDILNTGTIFPDQPEYAQLLASGISPESLASGRITRGELLRAGYIFLNRIGNGEKHIFSGDIPIIAKPGESVNYSNRTFLTREEVQIVYDYQQQYPDQYGTHGIPIDELRRDMLLFLRSAVNRPVFEYVNEFAHRCFPYEYGTEACYFSADHIIYTDEQFDTVATYLKAKAKEYMRQHPEKSSVKKWPCRP